MMPQLIVYLLKVNVALILFYAAYRFILRRLTFYYLNRLFLVFGILFSSAYPFVNVSEIFMKHRALGERLLVITPNWHTIEPIIIPKSAPIDYWQIPIALFWIGVGVMAMRLIMQLISLYKIHRTTGPANHHGQLYRELPGDVSPFSFWQAIYINPRKHSPMELDAIVKHEQIHVRQWHTLDVLLSELNAVVYWFNPGVWLIKQAVKENLEFITDRDILRSGIDEKVYQYSLVRVSNLRQSTAIVNNFNFLKIKKRIMMMNKKRSSRVQVTRYVIMLPLVMLLALVFTVSKAELNNKTITIFVKRVLPAAMVPQAETPVMKRTILTSLDTNVHNVTATGAGTLTTTAANTDSVAVDKMSPSLTMYGKVGYATVAVAERTDSDRLMVINSGSKKIPVVLNGKLSSLTVDRLDPSRIKALTFLSSDEAMAKYGKGAKNGVVEVKLKLNTDLTTSVRPSGDVVAVSNGNVIKTASINGSGIVLVRNGDRFDAYSNLASTDVIKGDKIGKGQVIGTVVFDPTTGKPALNYERYKGATRVSSSFGSADTTVNDTRVSIACTIDPNDLGKDDFKNAIKLFKDHGIDLNFDGTSHDALKVSIKSKNDNSASAVYNINKLKNSQSIVRISADIDNGEVSVGTEAVKE